MEYIRITKENIDQQSICCAMSNKQGLCKKDWLKSRFDEGLIYYKCADNGTCFIEFIPAEKAWVPIDAEGYYFINCLWISGAMKGQGYSNDLLNECIKEAKIQNKNGICILSSEKKKEFLSDARYLKHKGFIIADEAVNGIFLMYLPLNTETKMPKFKACTKTACIKDKGFVIFYTDQCPFAYYWVQRISTAAKEYGISLKVIHLVNREDAQNLPAPITTFALFRDGKYITHVIPTDKKFLKLAGIDNFG